MEFNKIDAICRCLFSISGGSFRTLKLDDDDDPVTKQDAVHSQSAASKIVLEYHISVLLEITGSQNSFYQFDFTLSTDKLPLEYTDTRLPLVVLLGFNMQTLRCGIAGQSTDYGVDILADKTLSTIHVPSRSSLHESPR